MVPSPVRIGTRGSELAVWQANFVRAALVRHWGIDVELCCITTEGDRIQDRPLYRVGGKGLFVKAIEDELAAGRVDLAVHSMKDVPAQLPEGLVIACTPAREDARDAVCALSETSLERARPGTRVGTSSVRRAALARRINPHIQIVPLRGNVPTRLRKLDEGQVDIVLLAAAGLVRLGLSDRIVEFLDSDRFCPAPCQGILAIECRDDDTRVQELLAPLRDPGTAVVASAERAFLIRLAGGCEVPVACHAHLRADNTVSVTGTVVDPSGEPCFSATLEGEPARAAELGKQLAEALLDMGAGGVVASLVSGREAR